MCVVAFLRALNRTARAGLIDMRNLCRLALMVASRAVLARAAMLA